MKVCYNLQSENPNKHELMPGSYPWMQYEVSDDFDCPEGYSELPLVDFEALKASFDLSAYNAAVLESAAMVQQKAQRQFGEQLARDIVDELGEEILVLETAETPADIPAIMAAFQPVEELLSWGLLKSARSALEATLPTMSAYETYIDGWASEITAFLTANGWDE